MLKASGIYKISSPSGKFYIGSSVNIHRRWLAHKTRLKAGKHHSMYLQRACNKYGINSLSIEIVTLCDRSELLSEEQFYIDSLSPEYNVCRIAGSCRGINHVFTEEHKRKIVLAHKGKKLSPEHCAMIGDVHRGKTLSDSHLSRLRELSAGESNPFYGQKHSKETIEKVSGYNHHSSKPVLCVETGEGFGSALKARDWLRSIGKPGASSGPIGACCKGSTRYSKAYGFTWKYVNKT